LLGFGQEFHEVRRPRCQGNTIAIAIQKDDSRTGHGVAGVGMTTMIEAATSAGGALAVATIARATTKAVSRKSGVVTTGNAAMTKTATGRTTAQLKTTAVTVEATKISNAGATMIAMNEAGSRRTMTTGVAAVMRMRTSAACGAVSRVDAAGSEIRRDMPKRAVNAGAVDSASTMTMIAADTVDHVAAVASATNKAASWTRTTMTTVAAGATDQVAGDANHAAVVTNSTSKVASWVPTMMTTTIVADVADHATTIAARKVGVAITAAGTAIHGVTRRQPGWAGGIARVS